MRLLAFRVCSVAASVRLTPSLVCPRVPPPLRMSRAAIHGTRMQYDDESYGMAYEQRPPSEKQVRYAQRLAQQLAKSLPQDALHDSEACSKFIDECLSEAPPSEKQVQFAQTIARDAGIELPAFVTTSSKACSEYINANQHLLSGRPRSYDGGSGGMGMGMGMGMGNAPTEKQILFAARLARDRNLGLSAEVLADKAAMSGFIDECLKTQATGGGAVSAGGVAPGAAAGFAGAAGAAGVSGMGDMAGVGEEADAANGAPSAALAMEEDSALEAAAGEMDALDRLFDDPEDDEEEGGLPSTYLKETDVPF